MRFSILSFLVFGCIANMAQAENLGCIAYKDIKPTHSLVDISSAIEDCAISSDYDYGKAADLDVIQSTYAAFDVARLKNSDDWLKVHNLVSTLGEPLAREDIDEIVARRNERFADAKHFAEVCTFLKSMGPPNYPLAYLNDGKSEPEHAEINVQEAWAKAVADNVNDRNEYALEHHTFN